MEIYKAAVPKIAHFISNIFNNRSDLNNILHENKVTYTFLQNIKKFGR